MEYSLITHWNHLLNCQVFLPIDYVVPWSSPGLQLMGSYERVDVPFHIQIF